ncbi:hypothetical protein BT96DRAFT_971011 [Gymnopus androsaceus JB14]|uniref:Uncharacterized protein n=1 Tax=Gymnopus androsaceus JB14 TaxID=1447944 RepID=A0A6A4ID87_9AGAR|nr:hypothetical protein BT96DRAFT_971011 [Gymnopus androsaceus JB14]
MKTITSSALALLALAGSSLAQGASFAYPLEGDTLVAGQSVDVRIDRATPSDPTTEAGIGLGMSACTSESCPSPETSFEYLFFAGGFNPQRPTTISPGEDFNAFQNFTITVPSINGNATLGFLHTSFGEGAAGFFPFSESVAITVNIVAA